MLAAQHSTKTELKLTALMLPQIICIVHPALITDIQFSTAECLTAYSVLQSWQATLNTPSA